MKVSIQRMVESSGESFWVTITNEKGQTITPSMFKHWTIPEYAETTISRAEALDRALIESTEWADFFGVERPVYKDGDGTIVEPSIILGSYADD